MDLRKIFNQFLIDLCKLNPNEITVVTYDSEHHTLQYSQLSQSFIATYISPYFLPKKRFKIGLLNQSGLNKLKYNLTQLLSNNLIDDGKYIPDLMELGTDFYRNLYPEVRIPRKTISLQYVNITNKLLVRYVCKHYNGNSKLLYDLAVKKSSTK